MLMKLVNLIFERWQIAAAVLAFLIGSHTLAYCEGRSDGRKAAESEYAALQAKALEKAREADQAASQAVTKGQDDVEAGNDRARGAALGSDDPLDRAFDSLRRDKARPSPPAD